MDEAGQKLKQTRERLNLRYRDVEEASLQIANRRHNDEFQIALSRLSDIENKGTVPSIFRLYSLCTIYRLDIHEVLDWYGVSVADQPADAASISIGKTHMINLGTHSYGDVLMPLSLDPGLDLKKTNFVSRMIQKWGKFPISLLGPQEMRNHRYAYVGSEDWSMYPIIPPESLILIDDSQRKIQSGGWSNEFERPIYLLEHRTGFFLGWCTLTEDKHVIVQSHPSSPAPSRCFPLSEVDIVGQVTGVATSLDQLRRRQTRA